MAEIFEQTQKPNAALRNRLAQQLDMSSRAVQIWFQNRRAKLKRDASEAQNNYLFDRDRRLSLHIYDRENNYYMQDMNNGVQRRASYPVGYSNQGYPPMMNGPNQYTSQPMQQYPPQNTSPYSNPLPPPPPQTQMHQPNMTYQNQNVYSPMGQPPMTQLQTIPQQPPMNENSPSQMPNDHLMVNTNPGMISNTSAPMNSAVSNYSTTPMSSSTTQNQPPMYIQYTQAPPPQQQNTIQQQHMQPMVSPINYPQNNTGNTLLQQPAPSQPQSNIMGMVNPPPQQQPQQPPQQQNNIMGMMDQNSSNYSSINNSNSEENTNVMYSQHPQQQQQQQPSQTLPSIQNFQPMRNLPSPPPLNSKTKINTYGYMNNATSPTSNGSQPQGNTSPHYLNTSNTSSTPYMNNNSNTSYQQGNGNMIRGSNSNECMSTPQTMYTKEPLSPISRDSSCGNTTPINWATNVVGNGMSNESMMNLNINTSTPQSYPMSTTPPPPQGNQANNNSNFSSPNNTNNSCYYFYPNQKPMNNGVCNSYISPIES